MDKLSLKRFELPHWATNGIGEKKHKVVKKNSTTGKIPLENNIIVKEEKSFIEFYINDLPLSTLLNELYNDNAPILKNSIGVLGSTSNYPEEILKLKQLLGKKITTIDVRKVYPASMSDLEIEEYMYEYEEQWSNPEILIYCCAACGDHRCGGVCVSIQQTATSFIWEISNSDKQLLFEFDKYHYYDLFESRIKYLEKCSVS